jgi:hypothetical protein
MKKKTCYILFFCLFFIIGSYFLIQHKIQKSKNETASLCINTTDESLIFKCNYSSSISYQAKYDMFYKHPQFFDRTFALYFKNAETDCLNYSNECIVRDLYASDRVLKKCADSGEYDCLKLIEINDNDIETFDKSISKNYQIINKNGYTIHNNPCSSREYKFFIQLNEEQKNKLSKQTLNVCNAQGDFYKQHPELINK